jgi:hypothetical protein
MDIRVERLAVVLPDAGKPGGPCLVVEMVSGADGVYDPTEEGRAENIGKSDADEADAEGPVPDGPPYAEDIAKDEPAGREGPAEWLAESLMEGP